MQHGNAINDFWCEYCRKDWTLECRQTIGGKWFVARCPKCRREVRRWRGGDVRGDPYWRLSEKVKMNREKYWKDVLQPSDPEFDKYYPKYKREREEKALSEDKKKWEEKVKN